MLKFKSICDPFEFIKRVNNFWLIKNGMTSIDKTKNMKSVRRYISRSKMTNGILSVCLVCLLVLVKDNECLSLKRSASPDFNTDNSETSLDKMNLNYDEYPMVVPKRAAMLLDRIMVALHHALEDNDREGVQRITDLYKSSRHTANNARFDKEVMQQFEGPRNDVNYLEMPVDVNGESGLNDIDGRHSTDESMMGLQRRGHGEGLGSTKNRVYWRCYFNAVTCF